MMSLFSLLPSFAVYFFILSFSYFVCLRFFWFPLQAWLCSSLLSYFTQISKKGCSLLPLIKQTRVMIIMRVQPMKIMIRCNPKNMFILKHPFLHFPHALSSLSFQLRFANILGQGNFLRVLLIQPATFLCDNIMELNLSFVCLQFHIAKTDETSLLYSVIQKDL